MIIGYDVNTFYKIRTGVNIYAFSALRALWELYDDIRFHFYSYSRRRGPPSIQFDGQNTAPGFEHTHIKHPSLPLCASWKWLDRPKIERYIGNVDIVHGLSSIAPASSAAKRVVTIYDLTFLLRPETHNFATGKIFPRFVSYSIERSHAIIAISEHTKRDILELYDVDEKKIAIAYGGIDHGVFRPIDDHELISRVKEKYKISRPYILYLGTIEPRKNVDVLLRSFLNIREKTKSDYQLVLAGKVGWKVEDLMEQINRHVAVGSVVLTGYVPEDDTVPLYAGAEVFAYPSQYEGFGIPLLEAMACGCPVVSTDSSSIPEVVGDAGALVQPNDAEALADAILTILEDDHLKQEMKRKSLSQAKEFSWHSTARSMKNVYDRLMEY